MLDFLFLFAGELARILSSFFPSLLVLAALFTMLGFASSQACNPGKTWWRSRGLFTDACYCLIIHFVAPYMRMALLIAGVAILSGFMSGNDAVEYLSKGRGPLSGWPFWGQVGFYLVASDFLLYWIHRTFHRERFWRYHAIHHSAEEVDWTTAYRFHPVNLWLGPFSVTALMLFLGISPAVILFLVPFDTVSAAFVHSNLKWTLGPLKYVIATPVFHRWHHTAPDQGGEKNFASTFSLWDVLFGTFYMPGAALPQSYGVDDPHFPRGFVGQMLYPFKSPEPTRAQPASPANASAPVSTI
jgi:sterol desaturase/sphingolipid hydroxylase (fatty acid hydroxylase superfamily)